MASADDYVERVRRAFGSLRAYLDWAPVSDEILSRPLGPKRPKRISDRVELKGEEQRIFFRWVTWEYRRRGFDPDDITRLIVAQTNPAMQVALAAAEKSIGARIRAGGFNPRPMKNADMRYILGTLSEHGLGSAVDIDPARNPILRASTWKAIGSAVGKSFDRRPPRWWRDPEALYDDVADLDARWSEMAREAYEAKRREQAAERFARAHPGLLAGGATLSAPEIGVPRLRLGPTPLLGVGADAPRVLSEEELRVEAVKGLLGDVVGEARELAALPGFHFFALRKPLVLALQRQGLLWGATFPLSVDLHHFELEDETPPP